MSLVLVLACLFVAGSWSSASARQVDSGIVSLYGLTGNAAGDWDEPFSVSSTTCQGLVDSSASTSVLSQPTNPPVPSLSSFCSMSMQGYVTDFSHILLAELTSEVASGTGRLNMGPHSIEFTYTMTGYSCVTNTFVTGAQRYCGYLTGEGTDTYSGAQVTLEGPVTHRWLCCSWSATAEISGSLTYYGSSSSAPSSTSNPAIAGTPKDGETLTASPGQWSGDEPRAYAYQWQRCDVFGAGCTNISEGIGQSYRLTSADVGKRIRVRVTATNDGGSDTATSYAVGPIAPAAPENESAPVVVGAPVQGQTLRATDGTWSGTTPQIRSYQWRRCTTPAPGSCMDIIPGGDQATYTLTADDVGKRIRIRVTSSNSAGEASAESEPTEPVVGGGGSCPEGQVGAPPNCVPAPGGACPAGQVGTPPACVITGNYSNSCLDSNAKVADGFAGSVYTELRVQKDPGDSDVTWACYRAWSASGSVDVGGRVDFDASGGVPGTPVLEPDSSGCSVTPVDLKVGPDETPILVGVNNTSTEVRACFRVASFHQRVTQSVPGGIGGVPVVRQDDQTVPDPQERQGPVEYPSTTCQTTPGKTLLANEESGSTWIAAYSAPGGPGETRLCVRGQGPVSAGGMLTVKNTTGVSPVVQGPATDTSPSSCTSNVLANGSDPARFSIRVTASNPASLCLLVGSSGTFGPPGQRFTLGTSGSPVVPVVWAPDPGTPG